MFKSFCDKCGNECADGKAASHRFDDLVKGAGHKLGLSVTFTCDNEIGPKNHLCDECLPELLLAAAMTFDHSGAVTKLLSTSSEAKRFMATKQQIERRLEAVAKKEQGLDAALAEAQAQVDAIKRQNDQYKSHIDLLNTQIQSLTLKNADILRQRKAQREQLEIDKLENPEYLERVDRRERLRAGK